MTFYQFIITGRVKWHKAQVHNQTQHHYDALACGWIVSTYSWRTSTIAVMARLVSNRKERKRAPRPMQARGWLATKRLYGSGDTNLFKGKGNLVKIGVGISRIQQHLCGEDEKIKKPHNSFWSEPRPLEVKKHLLLDYANKWPSINKLQHGQERSSSKTWLKIQMYIL